MHVEVPKSHSFKQFGGEYVMIVISIITALALEHTVQSLHHRHLAHEAASRIDAEIQANVRELDNVLKHNQTEVARLEALAEKLRARLQERKDHPNGPAQTFDTKVGLSVRVPTLRREAWEVAVASQAASWMSQPQLERYSGLYANMRDVQALMASGSSNFLNGPAMMDVFSNYQIGDGDPKALYRTLRQMISAYTGLDGNLEDLRKEMAKAAAEQH